MRLMCNGRGKGRHDCSMRRWHLRRHVYKYRYFRAGGKGVRDFPGDWLQISDRSSLLRFKNRGRQYLADTVLQNPDKVEHIRGFPKVWVHIWSFCVHVFSPHNDGQLEPLEQSCRASLYFVCLSMIS